MIGIRGAGEIDLNVHANMVDKTHSAMVYIPDRLHAHPPSNITTHARVAAQNVQKKVVAQGLDRGFEVFFIDFID